MNKVVNKFLLAGDEFMRYIALWAAFKTARINIYGTSRPFTKNKQRTNKLKKQ